MDPTKSTVSVVIPCFNGGRHLPETLACILAQTRAPDEILVVDDGSTDEATRALLVNPPPRVRVLHKKSNEGLGFARNTGVENTTGELIMMLDDDDLIAPECIEKMEKALLAHPEASFVYSQMQLFGEKNELIIIPRFNPYLELNENYCIYMAMIRRSVFNLGLRYPRMLGYEDWSFWLSCVEKELLGIAIDEPLFKYRYRTAAGLNRAADRVRGELMEEIRNQHPSLFTPHALADLKAKHAPGMELVFCGSESELTRLRSTIAEQSLKDVVITRTASISARDLLVRVRGKLFAQVAPDHLPLLERSKPSFLEQVARLSENNWDFDAIIVPSDPATLETALVSERIRPYPGNRHPLLPADFIFIRTQRISDFTGNDLPTGWPSSLLGEKVLGGSLRAALFAEDFFRQLKEVRSSWPGGAARQNGGVPTVITSPPPGAMAGFGRRFSKRVRRALVEAVGEDKTARFLHPLKMHILAALAWMPKLRAIAKPILSELPSIVRSAALPARPLLPPSHRQQRLLLDREPIVFGRLESLVESSGERKVLLMMPWTMPGGVDIATIEMARALHSRGYQLTLVTNIPSRNEWSYRFTPYVSDTIHLDKLVAPLDQVGMVMQLVRDRDIGALFTTHSWLGLDCAMAVKRRLPAVRTVDFWHLDTAYVKEACRKYDAALDLHMMNTQYLAAKGRKRGVNPMKLRIVRLSCDEQKLYNPARIHPGFLRARLRLAAESVVVGFVGRFHEDKRPLFVAQVFARIHSQWSQPNRPPHFVFIGYGPLERSLQKECGRLGLAGHVDFLPSDTPMHLALRDLSLLLMASKIEGQPLALLEAMAMEVPIVSTRLEGIPELVTPEVGTVVPNLKDEKRRLERLAEAALDILENESRRKEMGRLGRIRVTTEFNAKQTADTYRAIFEELFTDRPSIRSVSLRTAS
jgi:glycosyltransferase involved in cell wall biosynthesis